MDPDAGGSYFNKHPNAVSEYNTIVTFRKLIRMRLQVGPGAVGERV